MTCALICGVSGQDGALLARLLLSKGYRVVGTSRDAQMNSFSNLVKLNIANQVELVSMTLTDFRSVLETLSRYEPDEIYNLAGQSSVGLSFDQPVGTLESIATGVLNLLESVRFLGMQVKLYNAGSSESFGEVGETPCTELAPFRPRSPYAVAKATAFWQVANYRDAFGLYAASGILFNHESPLRPARFVTRKIVSAACRISRGSDEKLLLGNLSIQRDWGWAPEYVDAMWRILQVDEPQDFVIGTGETNSLQSFVETAFDELGLDWAEHVTVDESLYRPSEILISRADPTKALQILDWEAQKHMREVVQELVREELESQSTP